MADEEKGLVIAYLDPADRGHGGDWYYRNHLPCRSLAELPNVFTVGLDSVNRNCHVVAREADVLVLRNITEVDLLPIIAERKERRLLTVFEVSDDAAAVQPWSIMHAFRSNPDNHRLFLRLSLSCDCTQYTVSELQRVYGYLNPKGQVFANQLSPIPDRLPEKSESEFVIGWGGSHGHLDDMRKVTDVLSRWVMAHDDARLAVMGTGPICDLFSGIAEHKLRLRGTGSIHDYYAFLDPLHVGLAPLEDDAFNRSRSDVKFLEYAAHGAVALVSDFLPYQETVIDGVSGFRYGSLEQLVHILDDLHEKPALRSQITAQAYAYVNAERRQEQHASARLSFYERQLSAIGHQGKSASACRAFSQKMASWEGAALTGRHVQLEHGRFENAIYAGIILAQQDKRLDEARIRFQQAEKLAPESYLASLMLSSVSPDPRAAIEAAQRKSPRSIRAKMEMGAACAARGELEPALAAYLASAKIVPEFEQPYMRVAELLGAVGAEDAAKDMAARADALCAPLFPKEDA